MFDLFKKREDADDPQESSAQKWYEAYFEEIAQILLNLKVQGDSDMARKYPGEILCSNIAPLPATVNPSELVRIIREDGLEARVNEDGFPVIVYRKLEGVKAC